MSNYVYPSGSDGEHLNRREKLIRVWGKLTDIGTQCFLNTSPKRNLHIESSALYTQTIHNSYNGNSKHLANLFITDLVGAPALSQISLKIHT